MSTTMDLSTVMSLPPDTLVRREAWPVSKHFVRTAGDFAFESITMPPNMFGDHRQMLAVVPVVDAIARDWVVVDRPLIRVVADSPVLVEHDLFLLHEGKAVPIECDGPLPGRVARLVILPVDA